MNEFVFNGGQFFEWVISLFNYVFNFLNNIKITFLIDGNSYVFYYGYLILTMLIFNIVLSIFWRGAKA